MKKSFCVLLVLLMLIPFGLIAHAGEMPTIPLTTRKAGDANGDGSVDLKDVTAVSRYLAGGWGVSINAKNANINGDTSVDLRDVVLLRRYLAGGWGVVLV